MHNFYEYIWKSVHWCCWRTDVAPGGRIRVSVAICRTVLWVCEASSWRNTSSSTASMLTVVCAILGLPLPDFFVIGRSSLFQTLNKVVQRTFMSCFSRKFICWSNCVITFSKLHFLFIKIISCTLKPSFCYLITSELSSASLSWQRLQLVLCHINNFYGKVSSVGGRLLMSNIIDTVRFLEELWDMIGVSGF